MPTAGVPENQAPGSQAHEPRSWIGWNFIVALLVGLATFLFVFIAGLNETDPGIARANRAGIGAIVLAFVAIALLVLYLRRTDLPGLPRVFAGVLGVVGLIQNTAVPLVLSELYESQFPTASHMIAWYVYVSYVLFALIGDGRAATAEK
jgi:drug/metabolite transporter (DMT)-like permease